MANWTPAQSKAIETKDKTLLVSAAAGSGKTAVLIERIIRLITDTEEPLDISRLLIVTFTRAAASELRQRISSALTAAIASDPGNTRLFSQLASLGSAHISTIDSFYSDTVKKYSSRLGLPSSLRIADESELSPLRRRIMNDVLDMGYEGAFDSIYDGKSISFDNYEGATPFTAFADSISDMRNDSSTWETLIALRQKLLSHPRSTEFLLDCEADYVDAVTSDLFATPHGAVLRDHISDSVEVMIAFLTEACEYLSADPNMTKQYLPAFSDDLRFCTAFKKSLDEDTYEAVKELISSYSPGKLGSLKSEHKTEKCIQFVEFRKKFVKERLEAIRRDYFGVGCSPKELMGYAARSAVTSRMLYAVLSEFERIYSAEKLSRGICEFSDIKQWAYTLLVTSEGEPTDIAREISEGFDAVYIDEYQDVDPVQDLIFRAISKPRSRFMVGDVKQSIYGFRGSDPSLFMNYRRSFAPLDPSDDRPPEEEDCTIFMSSNFRCDQNVIDFTNSVCSYLFVNSKGEIEYTKEDDLEFAKDRIDGYISGGHPVSVMLVSKEQGRNYVSDDTENDNSGESVSEASYIAAEISRLIGHEKKANGSCVEAGDIAVLARAEKFLGLVGKELDKLGISHTGGKSGSIFDDPMVLITLSLLHAVDNPQKDIHLTAALLSPIFGFSADDLVLLRSRYPKCSVFDALTLASESHNDPLLDAASKTLSALAELRSRARSLSADRVIRLIFSEFSLLSRCDGEASARALTLLYESARKYEGDEFKGLYSFLRYVDDMNENGTAPAVADGDENAVQLLTIHKSKGLEFPVCFVSSCASRFNRDDTKKVILYSPELGLSADILDIDGFGKIKTPYRHALFVRIADKGTEEEMRLLYVALTRARERLYVTATVSKSLELKADFLAQYPLRGAIMSSDNYMTWIISALKRASDKDFFTISHVSEQPSDTSDEANAEPIIKEIEDVPFDEEDTEAVRRNMEFVYPFLHISNMPAKLSVSKLSPAILDRTSDSGEDEGADSLDISLPTLRSEPAFMSDEEYIHPLTAAERGTATHAFLQFCDFSLAKRKGVPAELERLKALGFLDERAAMAVNIRMLERFFASDLFAEIEQARRVFREQRFNILLPARAFTQNEEYVRLINDEKLLVQGVMDIFFEDKDGKLVLCDYKTDYLTREELTDPSLAAEKLNRAHARQLSYYAEALRTMLGRYPDRVMIYSLPLGDTVDVNLSAITDQ